MSAIRVTFITKPGCHLCDDARPTVEDVVTVLQREGVDVTLEEVNLLDDPDLERSYREDIPVVLIDGRRHAFWRVDATRMREAILKRRRRRFFR